MSLLHHSGGQDSKRLLDSTFLFHFSVPCLYISQAWSDRGIQLPETCRIPCFSDLEGGPLFADLRAAWNNEGVYFTVRVEGKRQTPWCRETQLDESDGLHVWIDTRNTHNVHRASRFCHRFAFLPAGSGRLLDLPVADQMLINRARENAKPIRPDIMGVRSEKRVDGYVLECCVPKAALTGYEPDDHSRLGFTYVVIDRELGWQTFTVSDQFRFQEDPSLWGSLELVRE